MLVRHPVCLMATVVLGTVSTAAGASYPPINFVGQSYDFHRMEKIACGSALYYAPHGQNPDQADDAIIVDYYDSQCGQSGVVSAKDIAAQMLQQDKARGAVIVAPFQAPDPLNKSQNAFFIQMYYVYPQDGNGDAYFSKVEQIGAKVVGVLYKHQVYGAGAEAITANIKKWFVQNTDMYGNALSMLPAPAAPTEPK